MADVDWTDATGCRLKHRSHRHRAALASTRRSCHQQFVLVRWSMTSVVKQYSVAAFDSDHIGAAAAGDSDGGIIERMTVSRCSFHCNNDSTKRVAEIECQLESLQFDDKSPDWR